MSRIYIGNVKGPQGIQGETGATGAAGAAATVNVGTVSTTAYGNPAQVTNSGTESAAVLDFVIPQGQPGEEVTDMSGLTLGTMTTQTAQFPTPQVGDTGATLWGKVVKYFSDLRTLIGTKLNISNVVNNFTTTESGYALDARAGKTLNDNLNAARYYNPGDTFPSNSICCGRTTSDGSEIIMAFQGVKAISALCQSATIGEPTWSTCNAGTSSCTLSNPSFERFNNAGGQIFVRFTTSKTMPTSAPCVCQISSVITLN